MLNHARTLLVNLSAETTTAEFFAEELIAPDFQPIELPYDLQVIRQQLFGSQPDRYMLNYRTKQLLATVHASPLERWIYALDPRITYDPYRNDLTDKNWFTPKVNKIDGAPADALTVIGRPQAPDDTGQCFHGFDIDVLSPTTVEVLGNRYLQKLVFNLTTLPAQTVTEPILLGKSGYSFFLHSTNPGQAYRVEVINRPQWSLTDIAKQVAKAGEPSLNFLFGNEEQQPYAECRRIWFYNDETPLRMAALVIALVFRTEQQRRRQLV